MMTASTRPASVFVDLPLFVGKALQMLPAFLEAIGTFGPISTIQYSPNAEDSRRSPEPELGWVGFSTPGGRAIFHYVYQGGEEGTLGGLNRLMRVELERQGSLFCFYLVEHHCSCRHCPGLKYPFCPGNMVEESRKFEEASEEDRLRFIRQYLKS